jgi:hypothetical protein
MGVPVHQVVFGALRHPGCEATGAQNIAKYSKMHYCKTPKLKVCVQLPHADG